MDNLKGLLMLCVVLGHFCEKYELTHPNLKYIIFLYIYFICLVLYIFQVIFLKNIVLRKILN